MKRPQDRDFVIEGDGGATVVIRDAQGATLLCPRCWTAQSTRRAFCWQCGAGFVFPEREAPPARRALGE